MSEQEPTREDEGAEQSLGDLDISSEDAEGVKGGGTDDEDLDQLQVQR